MGKTTQARWLLLGLALGALVIAGVGYVFPQGGVTTPTTGRAQPLIQPYRFDQTTNLSIINNFCPSSNGVFNCSTGGSAGGNLELYSAAGYDGTLTLHRLVCKTGDTLAPWTAGDSISFRFGLLTTATGAFAGSGPTFSVVASGGNGVTSFTVADDAGFVVPLNNTSIVTSGTAGTTFVLRVTAVTDTNGDDGLAISCGLQYTYEPNG